MKRSTVAKTFTMAALTALALGIAPTARPTTKDARTPLCGAPTRKQAAA